MEGALLDNAKTKYMKRILRLQCEILANGKILLLYDEIEE
jgi:hypothetical protein